MAAQSCASINRPVAIFMSDVFSTLSQTELLALAVDASRRQDSGHALAYLKEAASRTDVSARTLFMLGSEYAQLGMVHEAKTSMERAVEKGQDFPLARFQLGMLHAATQELEAARAVWQPLSELGSQHPQSYLATFQRGMLHLVADEFDAAIRVLSEGIAQNQENAPLNAEMRRIIDAVEHLPGRADAPSAAAAQAVAETLPATAPGSPATEADSDPSHLFISAYTQSSKPH